MPPKSAASARKQKAERQAGEADETGAMRSHRKANQVRQVDGSSSESQDEGSSMADVFKRLSGGSVTEDDLRLVFNAYRSEKTNRLQIKGFRMVLEAQQSADGASEPLPAGFVSSLFDAWCKEGGLNESRFIYGYIAYLKQRHAWLHQWLSANNQLHQTHADDEVLERLFVEVCESDQMSALEFLGFCEAWANEVDETPPPPGFCHYIFRAFLAGEAKKQTDFRSAKHADHHQDAADDGETIDELPALQISLSKEAYMECASIYVLKWHSWLGDWLKGREDIGSAVREFALAAPEALDAMPQQSEEDGHDEMSVWTVSVDRMRGERLGITLGERGKVQELEDGGLIPSWNEQFPGKAVRVGDCLLNVNGNSNVDLMSVELERKTILDMTVGREYPVQRFVMSHWVLEIDRSHGEITGFNVQTKRHDIFVVRSVSEEGLLAVWNETHPWRAVRPGDWFAEANGKSGVYEIAAEMKQAKLLKMTACRNEINHWVVQIDASTSSNLGIDVHNMHKETCEISHISRHGMLPKWNAEQPHHAVAEGDLILEVNSKSNPTEILAELNKKKVLEIVVLRPSKPIMVHMTMPVGAAAARAGPARYVGIKLRRKYNDDIEVKSIDPGSQISLWNASNPDDAIHPDDRILSVNGYKDFDMIKHELRQADVVRMQVLRKAVPWVVEVDGLEGDIGAQTHIRHDSEVEVKSIVLGGCASAWNFLHSSHAIRSGDRLKSVNGQVGAEAIAAELKKRQLLNMEVERDEKIQWSVPLDCTSKPDIGAVLHVMRQASLEVVGIAEEGLIPDQNKRHAARAVRIGDGIVEVNDVVSVDQMKQQLSRMEVMELTICREELAPASAAEAEADMADLPVDLGQDLEEHEAAALFKRFDRRGKGWWSDADVHYVCRLIWKRQGLPPPPRSFANEVLKRIREEAKQALRGAKGGEEHPTRLTSQEVAYGFSRFTRKHHDVFRRWASTRCRNQYKCPNCRGRFRMRLDASGLEVPQVAGGPTQLRSSAPPNTASSLFPLPAGIAALHEGVLRGVHKGSMTFALPPGSARPALSGRLLLETCASGLMRGSVGILAPPRELEATAAWLAATAPELPRQFLHADFPSVQLVSDKPWFGKRGGTIFFATSEVFAGMVYSDRVSIDDIDLVVCAAGPAEIPLVAEMQDGAPLSVLGGLPRVVCLLDASSSTHKALLEHLEGVEVARQHLQTAAKHLKQAPGGDVVAQTASSVDKMLFVAGRYPPTRPPEHVESRDAALSLAALTGRIDVRLLPHQKDLPKYATEEGRREAQQRAASAPRMAPAKAPQGAALQRQRSVGLGIRASQNSGVQRSVGPGIRASQNSGVQAAGAPQLGGGDAQVSGAEHFDGDTAEAPNKVETSSFM